MNIKEKILLAAAEEFSKKGYLGATIRDICGKAEVNVAAVNYYFSSKDDLYREVFNYLFKQTGKSFFHKVKFNIANESEWQNELTLFIRRLLQMFTSSDKYIEYIVVLFAREEHHPSEHFFAIFKHFFEPRIRVLKFLLAYTDIKNTDELNILVMNITFMLLGYAEKQVFATHMTKNENFITENIDIITTCIFKMVVSQIRYKKLNKKLLKSDLD